MLKFRTGYLFGSATNHWWVFAATGIFTWLSPYLIGLYVSQNKVWIVGACLVLFGVVLRGLYNVLEIDHSESRYATYLSFYGLGAKEYLTLPALSTIVLTSQKVSHWTTPNGVSPTFKLSYTQYTIGLFSNTDQPDIFMQTDNQRKARRWAKNISETLNLKLVQQF